MGASQRASRGFHQFVRLFVTRTLACVVLAMMLTGGAVAGPLEDAWAAYQSGDYATALRLWRPRAAQGVALAQNNLGLMYYNGQGLPQDYDEAAKWYRLAAEQGNATAQSNLVACTTAVKAFRRTTFRLTCGSVSPPHGFHPRRKRTESRRLAIGRSLRPR